MATISYEEIGRRLSHARRHAGFTQQLVAKYLEINREQLSYIENGRRPVDLVTLQRLADLYGFALPYFVTSEAQSVPEVSAAFRVSSLADADLQVIGWVKRLARNLDALQRIESGGDSL